MLEHGISMVFHHVLSTNRRTKRMYVKRMSLMRVFLLHTVVTPQQRVSTPRGHPYGIA